MSLYSEQPGVLANPTSQPLADDEWGFVCTYGIGDTYMVCLLAEHFLEQYGGKIVMAVRESHQGIIRLFPSTISRHLLIDPQIYPIDQFSRPEQGKFVIAHPYHHPETGRDSFESRIGICNLLDTYKTFLGCESVTKFPKPRLNPEIRQSAKQRLIDLHLPLGRTVILAPECRSIRNNEPPGFWESLAFELTKHGWSVCTNVTAGQHPLPGTTALTFPLEEAIPIIEEAGWLISVRSGLCDLASSAECTISVIYPDSPWYQGTVYSGSSLKLMQLQENTLEYQVRHTDNCDDLVRRIIHDGYQPERSGDNPPSPGKEILTDVIDFWHDDSPAAKETNGLIEFLRLDGNITINTTAPDIALCSCFGDSHTRIADNILKVQYLGENHRPDTNHYHCSLSFDRNEDNTHMRLPLYVLYREWYEQMWSLNSLQSKKHLIHEDRKFCGALVSNSQNGARNAFMEMLMDRGLLESGGSWMNNIDRTIPQEESISFRKNYRFFLAFENSSHPGYVTEKILGAMAAGCIPVYWGAPDVGLDFNEDSFINCHHYDNFDRVIDKMIKIHNSKPDMASILTEPWVLTEHREKWHPGILSKKAIGFILSNLEKLQSGTR